MKANQAAWPVRTMCRVLGLSPSGYYAWVRGAPSARARRDAHLTERIKEIWSANREVYGRPRIHAELQAGGERIGAKRVGAPDAPCRDRRRQPQAFDEDHHARAARCPRGAGSGGSGLQRRRHPSAVGGRHRAPRGALEPCGGGRPPPSARRSGPVEAEGSLSRGTPGKAEAALTTTGRASTVRWCGSGKRDGKVYARNQRRKAPQAKTTSSNLTDRGWVATRIRPARPVGELLGWVMSPAGRPR